MNLVSLVVEPEIVHKHKKAFVQLYIKTPTPHAFKSFWLDSNNNLLVGTADFNT